MKYAVKRSERACVAPRGVGCGLIECVTCDHFRPSEYVEIPDAVPTPVPLPASAPCGHLRLARIGWHLWQCRDCQDIMRVTLCTWEKT